VQSVARMGCAGMMQYNPLGLIIIDFHADQAFH
jgi:hypothetical protein